MNDGTDVNDGTGVNGRVHKRYQSVLCSIRYGNLALPPRKPILDPFKIALPQGRSTDSSRVPSRVKREVRRAIALLPRVCDGRAYRQQSKNSFRVLSDHPFDGTFKSSDHTLDRIILKDSIAIKMPTPRSKLWILKHLTKIRDKRLRLTHFRQLTSRSRP